MLSSLSRWSDLLSRTKGSLWHYVLRASCASFLPAMLLGVATVVLLNLCGVDPETITYRHFELTPLGLFYAIVFAPIVETLVMSWPIALISSTGATVTRTSVYVGLGAGLLHAFNALGAILPVGWAFYIFATAYQVWRPQSYRNAFFAAAGAHALHNLLVVFFDTVFELVGL